MYMRIGERTCLKSRYYVLNKNRVAFVWLNYIIQHFVKRKILMDTIKYIE